MLNMVIVPHPLLAVMRRAKLRCLIRGFGIADASARRHLLPAAIYVCLCIHRHVSGFGFRIFIPFLSRLYVLFCSYFGSWSANHSHWIGLVAGQSPDCIVRHSLDRLGCVIDRLLDQYDSSIMYTLNILSTLLTILSLNVHLGYSQSCYWPNGNELAASDNFVSCGADGGDSQCCGAGHACMSNGLCFDAARGSVYRGGCTDKNWTTDACPRICNSMSGMTSLLLQEHRCMFVL